MKRYDTVDLNTTWTVEEQTVDNQSTIKENVDNQLLKDTLMKEVERRAEEKCNFKFHVLFVCLLIKEFEVYSLFYFILFIHSTRRQQNRPRVKSNIFFIVFIDKSI